MTDTNDNAPAVSPPELPQSSDPQTTTTSTTTITEQPTSYSSVSGASQSVSQQRYNPISSDQKPSTTITNSNTDNTTSPPNHQDQTINVNTTTPSNEEEKKSATDNNNNNNNTSTQSTVTVQATSTNAPVAVNVERHINIASEITFMSIDTPYTNTVATVTDHDNPKNRMDSDCPSNDINTDGLELNLDSKDTDISDPDYNNQGIEIVSEETPKNDTHAKQAGNWKYNKENNNGYTNNKIFTSAKDSQHAEFNKKLFELIIRLIVVYTVSLTSTMVVMSMYAYLFVIFGNQDYGAVRQANIFIRNIYVSESIICCMVLLFQNVSAKPLYYKFCCICHYVVKQCCLKCTQSRFSQSE